MSVEIERKFLVSGEWKHLACRSMRITQAYLNKAGGCTVRVRRLGEQGYLTIKGASPDGGLSRYEWEKEISLQDVDELMKLAVTGVIDKTRYYIPVGKHIYEVDEFHGDNEGLVVAEIELSDPQEKFEKPLWLGDEVTGQAKYYNSMLSRLPYCKW